MKKKWRERNQTFPSEIVFRTFGAKVFREKREDSRVRISGEGTFETHERANMTFLWRDSEKRG